MFNYPMLKTGVYMQSIFFHATRKIVNKLLLPGETEDFLLRSTEHLVENDELFDLKSVLSAGTEK